MAASAQQEGLLEAAACQYPSWYPKYARHAIRSILIPLPSSVEQFLQEDGITLADDTTAVSSHHHVQHHLLLADSVKVLDVSIMVQLPDTAATSTSPAVQPGLVAVCSSPPGSHPQQSQSWTLTTRARSRPKQPARLTAKGCLAQQPQAAATQMASAAAAAAVMMSQMTTQSMCHGRNAVQRCGRS
jgi:hypothetical protein